MESIDSVTEQKEYTIRTQSNVANTYGLGEVVAPNCAYFADGNYDLDKEQLEAKLRALGKAVLR